MHLGGALIGWGATFAAGITAAFEPQAALLTPWLAALSLAWSGFWLVAVPNNPRFKRAVDARLKAKYENDFSYQAAALGDRIDTDLMAKVDDITRLRNRAREILTTKFGEHDLFAKDNLEKLDKLAISYLQLLTALSEYDEYLSLVDPQSIERELESAESADDSAEPQLAEVRQRQVELLKNRLTRYRRAGQRLKLLQAQCRNVETTMKLLIDQAMTAPDAERVGRDIDQVLNNIRESELLTAELASYDDLERELDDTRMKERE
jgi:hypothetical protein